MPSKLLIVESKEKAINIQKYLGPDWIVRASFGHVTDLPTNEYGVDLNTFEEKYVARDEFHEKTIATLKQLARSAEHVYLGTDPDREGEAIAWHLVRVLSLRNGSYSRVRWRDTTKATVQKGLDNPGPIDLALVEAQRARRILDRIVGYDVSSQICWPAGAKAAGRVQSAVLHFICEREREIQAFVPEPYFTLAVEYAEGFRAFIPGGGWAEDNVTSDDAANNGQQGDEEDGSAEDAGVGAGAGEQRTGRLTPKWFRSREEAERLVAIARTYPHVVRSIEKRRTRRAALSAYRTSTVQADAGRKLGLSPDQTMKLLQWLFDNGHITYHRTDSTRLSDEFIERARAYIAQEYPEALSPKPRSGRGGAQDGHEAIRPTSLDLDPETLPADTRELYKMIRARALASQCKPPMFDRTTIWIQAGDTEWVAIGSVLIDPGYLVYWGPYAQSEDTELPKLSEGQDLHPTEYVIEEKTTQPPKRYDEPSLVMLMERTGIGRPSTYDKTILTLKNHGYVENISTERGKKYLRPTDHGMKVDELLTECFPSIVSAEYTATMETALDSIESGEITRIGYLTDWYADFRRLMEQALPKANDFIARHNLKPRAQENNRTPTDIVCDRCEQATYVKIKRRAGRGSFLACSDEACGFTRDVTAKVRKHACKADGCGGNLVQRKRQNGKGYFMACARKGCNYIENEDGRPASPSKYQREETDKKCPRCERRNLALFTLREPDPEGKAGGFFACPDRQKCGFTAPHPARVHRIPCEKCGGMMFRYFNKQGIPFYSCAKCNHTRNAEST